MADNQSTIALNIGTQRVSMAVFDTSKSGSLILKGYDTESILADPATDALRASQIRNALSELVSRMGSKGKVRYTVSGQSVFIRFVKLPPLDDDNIEQLVTFEAQQNVPFSLDEVVWDYEILEADGEKEVVIVAIKGDALEETNDSVNATGLGTAEVDVAPMALYNAFRAAYPNVTEPTLIIDVGAKTSDLLYIEGDRFFTRSAAVGGSAVTTAIAKEFEVSFAEAEAHKTNGGMVALGGGHTEQLDEAAAALAMCIRNAMTRLATEIPRTTNYFRSQHGGNAPKRVFLAGGGANLPYAKEFFEEKLRLPVEYFNPLPAIKIGSSVDTERLSREAHTMGELVGLGLRSAGQSKLNIDLVPSKVGEARAAAKRKPFLIAAAALLILGAAVGGLALMQAAENVSKEADEVESQLQVLSTPAGGIDRQISKEEELRAIATTYTDGEAARLYWPELYAELSHAFASEFVWITDFDPVANYDPNAEKPEPGKSVIKREFTSTAYGVSSLNDVTTKIPGRSKRDPVTEIPADITAIRLRGFWLDNPDNQNVVHKLVANIQENIDGGQSHFTFTVGEGKEARQLEKSEIAPILEADPVEGEFAAPFELVLPLAKPLPYR